MTDDVEYKAHPVAALFPLLDKGSPRYQDLLRSIKLHGQLHPVVINIKGEILDGRNRERVCAELGIATKSVSFMSLKLNVDEATYAFEANYSRRDLTDDQRAIAAAKFEALQGKGGGGSTTKGKTRERLAKFAKVSTEKIRQAIKVTKSDPELADKVGAGTVKLGTASRIVDDASGKPARKRAAPPRQASLPISRGFDPDAPDDAEVTPNDAEQPRPALAVGNAMVAASFHALLISFRQGGFTSVKLAKLVAAMPPNMKEDIRTIGGELQDYLAAYFNRSYRSAVEADDADTPPVQH